ncbi:MAG: hypothetical protein IJT14_00985 [Rickettsiales bacterium]|nr:hypothetical protein [Rickettsiales bacterium]
MSKFRIFHVAALFALFFTANTQIGLCEYYDAIQPHRNDLQDYYYSTLTEEIPTDNGMSLDAMKLKYEDGLYDLQKDEENYAHERMLYAEALSGDKSRRQEKIEEGLIVDKAKTKTVTVNTTTTNLNNEPVATPVEKEDINKPAEEKKSVENKVNVQITKEVKEEKKASKRDEYINSDKADKSDKKDEKKEEKKTSWIDDWLIEKSVKPLDYTGAYATAKLMLLIPNTVNISANETRNLYTAKSKVNLFTGQVKYGFMPGLFLAAGNDKFKWFRWETELGYMGLRSTKTDKIKTDIQANPGSEFTLSKKDASAHVLTLGFNAFLQHDFADRSFVGFIGLGLGVGYAWSWGKKLDSSFVLPTVSMMAGISFMLTKNSKLNISYRLMYMSFDLNSKYPFEDKTGILTKTRPITGGGMNFKNVFINAITLEYQFYKG